jgi:hypothetical protein
MDTKFVCFSIPENIPLPKRTDNETLPNTLALNI